MNFITKIFRIMAQSSNEDKEKEDLKRQLMSKVEDLKHVSKVSGFPKEIGEELELILKRLNCKLTLSSLEPEDAAPEICLLEEAIKTGDQTIVHKIMERLLDKFAKSSCTIQDVSPVNELMKFMNRYLELSFAQDIESKATQHVQHPESDISGFIDETRHIVIDSLKQESSRQKEMVNKVLNDYKMELMRTADCEKDQERTSHVCSKERRDAGQNLIDSLGVIIPEAKRANIKRKATHIRKGELPHFIDELTKDVYEFIDDGEHELKEVLNLTLSNFMNDLTVLSKQNRMVSKINLLEESVNEENISPEIKSAFNSKTEPIKAKLMDTKLTVTPEMADDLNNLAEDVRNIAQQCSNRFKGVAKDFMETVDFVCSYEDQ